MLNMAYLVSVFEHHSTTSMHTPLAFQDFLNRWADKGYIADHVLPYALGYLVVFKKNNEIQNNETVVPEQG